MNEKIQAALYPFVGIVLTILLWQILSGSVKSITKPDGTTEELKTGFIKDLPGPVITWQRTKKYILEPFAKREELDEGVLRFTSSSVAR